MEFDPDMIVVFSLPFLLGILGIAYSAYNRHLKHKERMAMIEKGIVPEDVSEEAVQELTASKGSGAGPITVTLVGIAITIGLLTIGVGPWLIGGLVPTAIGCAMLIQQIIEDSKNRRDEK